MIKILVVEDEDSIRELIILNLEMARYEVVGAANAEDALKLFLQCPETYSCAILDIMLPGMNGITLCENIRAASKAVGIVMLSAKSLEADKIEALSIGADDYMTKPFSISELKARIEALCRRVKRTRTNNEEEGKLQSGNFTLDSKSRVLLKNNKLIELTQVEFQIMELFFKNSGIAMVREKILEGVWGNNYFGDVKIVDVNIRRLRMKIEDDAGNPQHILTVWGYGYRWNV
jgi:DNA-binding response OmpR family regulator